MGDPCVVLPLADVGREDIRLAGGKGANLGELLRAGFPVPDGFVVTTAAFDDSSAGSGSGGSGSGGSGSVRPVSDALAGVVAAAYASLGGGPVAVRSSATAEDLPTASFAGQQDTYLGVVGTDAVVDAVARCWASLFTERAVAYRAAAERAGRDAPGHLSMAVVVQLLVEAEVAGVLFTAHPVTGRRDESVITAAWGLGESVVGGTVEPDEFVVGADRIRVTMGSKQSMTVATDGGVTQRPTPDDRRRARTLTDDQARALASLGARIAAHFGSPQDIEWVLAGGEFQIVQARPITALPEPSGPVPTTWPVPRPGSLYFRASIVEHLPDPLSPLFADMAATAVPAGLQGLVAELSPRTATLDVEFPTIHGYAFYDYSRRAWNQMWSFTPAGLAHLSRSGFVHDRWRDRELPRFRRTVAAWDAKEAAALASVELLTGAQELVDATCLYYTTVQSIIPVAAMAEIAWTTLHSRVLARPHGPDAAAFLVGFDSEPIRAEKSLFDLAAWCREHSELASSLTTPALQIGDAAPEGVAAEVWAEFRRQWDAHLAAHGHLLFNLDLMNPVPADDPEPVLVGLRYALEGQSGDPHARQRAQAVLRERITAELMGCLDPVLRRLARRSLALAQRWAPIREDALAALGLAWPTARRLLRELGGRLVGAGALASAEDVYWLTRAEAEGLASDLDRGAPVAPHSEIVEARQVAWRGQRRATPPQYLPQGGGLRWLESMMPARESGDGPVLSGTTGSGGTVTGRARVVAGPEDFAAFAPGEILVAAITTPAYTPLFARAAGVVTDIGGVLSHGSIVAREYGIPAVLGTGAATRRIATGDEITVDGVGARVVLDEAEATPATADAAGRVAAALATAVALGAVGALSASVWRRRH
ncbi:PEP/pyruvate-binding domain-containing protein [Propioniciclava soli]|uniref:PEP/pyruvate-binding domain-containing protein n=1 Tax=Propioniciclava soli TaxID=2775081 RepID=A0ABZ3C6R6_9ACTN